jgi:outer membrane murein-binding lipoprotein Lpp
MKSSFTHAVATIVLITLSGCKVYYSTADVDTKLKANVQEVNSTLTSLQSQVKELEKQYNEIPCDKKSESFLRADGMKHQLDNQMRSLEQMKQTVNND